MTAIKTPEVTDTKKRRWGRSQMQAWGLIVFWIILIAVFSATNPSKFFTHANLANILSNEAVEVIVALALLLPLSAGDFDLSIASNAGMSSMVVATLNVNDHVSMILSIIIALLAGVAVGIINGFVIVALRVDAFIATLGMGTLLSGLTLAISGGNTIILSDTKFISVVNGSWFGIAHCFFAAIALTVVLWYLMEHTMVGRRALFVGLSPTVARLSGIRVDRVRWGALITSGFLAALGGVAYVGTLGAADPSSAQSFLLPAFAAAFLGATTITPGRFNAWGITVATYFLATGFTGLELLGVQDWVQQVFYGAILIVAVAFSAGGITAWNRRRARRAPPAPATLNIQVDTEPLDPS